ncbi:U4/U6-U5 snRNP complex subunit prp31 [Coemansia helicoidea]|uniref:U4/U6-U5 snRNP complex subunit prp31 n=1 Tax=Coemansia helicoidea TaxID=1286919 RepID=A0ACC1LG79_9FUNG|nr:U4/U6-U5 snRNP complex subunit prp31 [Coemansia helicoidea]
MAFDDDLLAELDELGGDDQMDVAEGGANTVADIAALGEASGAGGIDEEHEALIGRIASSAASIHAIATLGRSSELRALLDDVARSQQTPVADRMVVGRAEDDPDYRLVLRANEMSARIAGEALVTHRFLVDHYRARFPELETLVRNPLEYARTVKAIGASADISKVELGSVLPNATQMVVALTGSTSSGRLLGADEQRRVDEAADYLLDLSRATHSIVGFIETRMPLIAPNLTAVIGGAAAAKLIVEAGGLTALSKIPSCNIQVLGKTQHAQTGFASLTVKKHAGIVFHSDAVRAVPEDFRDKMVRKISAKCALAARVDAQSSARDGALGRRFRAELDAQVEKLLEAAPVNAVKPLPIPDEGPKRRRGGRKARRAKEPFTATELQRQRDRLQFGTAQEEVVIMDEMEGAGMLGHAVGRVRATQMNNRAKAKVAKKYEKYLKAPRSVAAAAGTASLAFTPAQGFELISPQTEDAHKSKRAKTSHGSSYFASNTPFLGRRDG